MEDRLDRLVPLAGDIAAEDLGLSDEARAILAAAPADECWHSAASLRYEDRHKDEIVGTNVDGTRHLLDAITGLGIGGIAVGFAAKDLFANLLGGLTIYLDRPFTVGEWIRSPDKNIEGTVEQIGWRNTCFAWAAASGVPVRQKP